MTEKELIRRADLALSDLVSTGGIMQPEMANRFSRKVMDEGIILKEARHISMSRPKMEINKIGFSTRVLRPANQGLISSPRSGEEGTRALSRADRAKPVTERIQLETKELIAEVDLPYETLEDNIEGGGIEGTQFQQTILDLLAARVALDLEELVVLGDTTNVGDPYLAMFDGVLAQAVSNIVNQGGDPMDPQLFASMIKALPTKYHKLLGQMKFYLSRTKEIDYRMTVAQRQTQLGDSLLTGSAPVSALGVPMTSAVYMPASNAILTLPKNLIIGTQRDMRIEFDKDIRERAIVMVVTMRIAMKYEEEDMVVKAINIG